MDQQQCGRCRIVKSDEEYSPSYRGRPGTWCRACFAEYNRFRKHGSTPPPSVGTGIIRTCEYCGSEYQAKQNRHSQYCSRECKANQRNERIAAEKRRAKPERHCAHCSAVISQSARSDAKYCSRDCNNAAHAVTRKMAKRAGRSRTPGDPLVERNQIALRDGFRCGICGDKVNMKLRHPHPMCASIDHVVSLAEFVGEGANDLANLQLSHLRCNISKGARPHVGQLRLIG